MVILRAFIIAVRYGYASQFRVNMLTKFKQDAGYIQQDLLVPSWFNFSPEGLEIEIEAALWRQQI